MTENWKQISGRPDYEVSDLGRVCSLKWGKHRILKQSDNSAGYPHVNLFANGKRKTRMVHLLVAEAFLGPCPEGHEVNHKDGVKRHNDVMNLEWVTSAENSAHAERLGLVNHAHGERQGRSKLTAAQVIEMRRLHAEGASQRELAKRFVVSRPNVGHIVNFKTWRHVPHVSQKGRGGFLPIACGRGSAAKIS